MKWTFLCIRLCTILTNIILFLLCLLQNEFIFGNTSFANYSLLFKLFCKWFFIIENQNNESSQLSSNNDAEDKVKTLLSCSAEDMKVKAIYYGKKNRFLFLYIYWLIF